MPRSPRPIRCAAGLLAMVAAGLVSWPLFTATARSATADMTGEAPETPAAALPSGAHGKTGLPLPRFVSLKSGNVNVRRGPGQEYDLSFTFVRAGLPVEITQEFDNWRKIRDSDGSEGWVFHSLLGGTRTALVAPWAADGQFPARIAATADARVAAFLQPRVVATVEQCTGNWCQVSGKGFEGWIEQDKLWGVYPQEQFKE